MKTLTAVERACGACGGDVVLLCGPDGRREPYDARPLDVLIRPDVCGRFQDGFPHVGMSRRAWPARHVVSLLLALGVHRQLRAGAQHPANGEVLAQWSRVLY